MKRENYLMTNLGFKDINPKTCGRERCDPLHHYGPSSREYYLLHYISSGQGVFYADDTEYHLQAGDCFFIRPFEIISYCADKTNPWHYIWVGFECNADMPFLSEVRTLSSNRIGKIFRQIPDMGHMENGREAFLCAKIWEILSVLSPKKDALPATRDYVQMAISYIETEYMLDISIAALAAQFGLNRSYFSTIFKEQTGVSPQKYLTDFRLQKAAELITEHDYSITQAALSTGYTDLFNFSKMFRRHFDISPSAYKKKSANY